MAEGINKVRKFFVAFVLVWSTSMCAMAQENEGPASESEKPKTEVEKVIEEAAQHGELILGACLEDCTHSAIIAGLERGRALELPKPAYPDIARAGKADGQVNVKLVVSFDGTVDAASAISGNPLLVAAALKAAREARFVPWKLQGRPIRVVVVISYNFVFQ